MLSSLISSSPIPELESCCVTAILRTSQAQEALFDALAQSSLSEALVFARARPEFVHQQLFRRLVLGALDPACPAKAVARVHRWRRSSLRKNSGLLLALWWELHSHLSHRAIRK
ncbi:hypothetical protein MGN70_009386 [Eutypa lata]|nr:hypothetical protein MGN70_009386 [Eutypa lata]